MSKCPNCGLEVENGMKFCGECGTAIPQTKECPACHAQWPLASKFCGECGYNFNAVKTSSSLIGDKNVIAGDVHIDQSSTVNNNTVNNITNTTNNVINNVINQDETKKVVQCVVCGNQLPIIESCVCSGCNSSVCKEHFNTEKQLCDSCITAQCAKNEENFKRFLLETYEANKDLSDDELLYKIDKQRMLSGMTADGVLDVLRYWDDDIDDLVPIAEGIEGWFFKVCQISQRVALSHYLGRCYENGVGLPDGVVSDIAKAVEIYKRAAINGDEISEAWLKELNPKKISIRIKPRSCVEIGISEIKGLSSAYEMDFEDRRKYRAIPQHDRKFMMPILKDAIIEVSERSMIEDGTKDRLFSFSVNDLNQEIGVLFDFDEYDYGENNEISHLVVAKYHDGAEFFGSGVITGEFDISRLSLCTEVYDDSFCRDKTIDSSDVLKRLGAEVNMLRYLEYGGEEIKIYTHDLGGEVFCRTSHLFSASEYDWDYNVFSDKENIRRVKIQVFGPGIDVRGLYRKPSQLKDMTKYDIASWDDTWNSFTSTKLLLESASVRVTDVYTGDMLFEGSLYKNASLIKSKNYDFEREFLFSSTSDAVYGVTAIFDRMFAYERIKTCCYDGVFLASMIEVPYFTFKFFGENQPRLIAVDVEDFKLNGFVFGYSSEDAEKGEPMDIVDLQTWIQYQDHQESWNVLTLEDALALQNKSAQ